MGEGKKGEGRMEKEDKMKMEVVVDGVSKRYGKVEALQDVSFSVTVSYTHLTLPTKA